MARLSHTRTVTFAAPVNIDFPTGMDAFYVRNFGANRVWYASDNTATTASVEGNDMEFIAPNETAVFGGRKTCWMIAETADCKILITGAQGRI